MSRPVWGAWIEILLNLLRVDTLKAAPRIGRGG